jgi:hypothetical protein
VSKKILKKDFCRYYGVQYQLRVKPSLLKVIIKTISSIILKYKLDYLMVIADGLAPSPSPLSINKSYCDALIESGSIFDNLIKLKSKNSCIQYNFNLKTHKKYNIHEAIK